MLKSRPPVWRGRAIAPPEGLFCNFSGRTCMRNRVDGYELCIRHILDDKNSPFKQCQYVSTKSGRRCPYAAPKSDKKDGYCWEHATRVSFQRQRAMRRKRPRDTPESIFDELSQYVPLPPDGNQGDSGVRKRASITNNLSSKVLEYASSSDSEAEPPLVEQAWKGDAESDCDSIDSDQDDPLKHAGVYTAEEVALIMRDKLIRLQSLYIDQFRHLQYVMREKRRTYLHDVKQERETLCGLSAYKSDPENKEKYNKLQALKRYHKRHGKEALLHRRCRERRISISDGVNYRSPYYQKCMYSVAGGGRCNERSVPLSKYCMPHILHDPHQVLFQGCNFADGTCNKPVPAVTDVITCPQHQPLLEQIMTEDTLPLIDANQYQQNLLEEDVGEPMDVDECIGLDTILTTDDLHTVAPLSGAGDASAVSLSWNDDDLPDDNHTCTIDEDAVMGTLPQSFVDQEITNPLPNSFIDDLSLGTLHPTCSDDASVIMIHPTFTGDAPVNTIHPTCTDDTPVKTIHPTCIDHTPVNTIHPTDTGDTPVNTIHPTCADDTPVNTIHRVDTVDTPVNTIHPTCADDTPVNTIPRVDTVDTPVNIIHPTDTGDTPVNTIHPTDTGDTPVNIIHPTDTGDTPVNTIHPTDTGDTPVNTIHRADTGDTPVNTIHPTETGDTPVNTIHPTETGDTPVSTIHPTETGDTPVNTIHRADTGDTPVNTIHPTETGDTPVNTIHPTETGDTPVNTIHPTETGDMPVRTIHPTDTGDTLVRTIHPTFTDMTDDAPVNTVPPIYTHDVPVRIIHPTCNDEAPIHIIHSTVTNDVAVGITQPTCSDSETQPVPYDSGVVDHQPRTRTNHNYAVVIDLSEQMPLTNTQEGDQILQTPQPHHMPSATTTTAAITDTIPTDTRSLLNVYTNVSDPVISHSAQDHSYQVIAADTIANENTAVSYQVIAADTIANGNSAVSYQVIAADTIANGNSAVSRGTDHSDTNRTSARNGFVNEGTTHIDVIDRTNNARTNSDYSNSESLAGTSADVGGPYNQAVGSRSGSYTNTNGPTFRNYTTSHSQPINESINLPNTGLNLASNVSNNQEMLTLPSDGALANLLLLAEISSVPAAGRNAMSSGRNQ